MKRGIPKHQPKMDFRPRLFTSEKIVSTAPPRPPFAHTFSELGWGDHLPSLQPNYPYPSAWRWHY